MKNQTQTIDPNRLKTRDYLMLKVIGGATKAGVAKDRKKEASRLAVRRWRQDRRRDE